MMDIFNDPQYFAALGTWFSGIMMAITVAITLITIINQINPKLELYMQLENSTVSFIIHNGSKGPVFINSFGIYYDGKYHALNDLNNIEVDVGRSITIHLSSEEWDEMCHQTIHDISKRLDGALIWQFYVRLRHCINHNYALDSSRSDFAASCSVKFAIWCSGRLLISTHWMRPFIYAILSKRYPSLGSNRFTLKKYWDADVTMAIPLYIIMMLLCVELNLGWYVSLAVLIGAIVFLYGYVSIISVQHVHSLKYYTLLCLIIWAVPIYNLIVHYEWNDIMELLLPSIVIVLSWLWLYARVLSVAGISVNVRERVEQ